MTSRSLLCSLKPSRHLAGQSCATGVPKQAGTARDGSPRRPPGGAATAGRPGSIGQLLTMAEALQGTAPSELPGARAAVTRIRPAAPWISLTALRCVVFMRTPPCSETCPADACRMYWCSDVSCGQGISRADRFSVLCLRRRCGMAREDQVGLRKSPDDLGKSIGDTGFRESSGGAMHAAEPHGTPRSAVLPYRLAAISGHARSGLTSQFVVAYLVRQGIQAEVLHFNRG